MGEATEEKRQKISYQVVTPYLLFGSLSVPYLGIKTIYIMTNYTVIKAPAFYCHRIET